MNAWLLRLLLPLAACPLLLAHADAPPLPGPAQADPLGASGTQPAPPPSARPSDKAIKAAVRAVLEEMPPDSMPAGGTVLSGGAYQAFARKFSEAEKPHCLGPNATRHQPSGFSTKNWNFGFGGLAALPFWGAAILRGKCNWTR